MSSTLQISVEELRKWLEKETISFCDPIRSRGSGMLSDLRSRLDEVEEASQRLYEDAEKDMRRSDSKTYHASRAASRLTRNLIDKIGKITLPKSVSYESLRTLDGELKEMLMSIGMDRRRWFQHIEPYFIMNRRRLDTGLRKLVESAEKIQGFLSRDYTKAKLVEDEFGAVDNFLQSVNESGEFAELEKQNSLQLKILEEKIAEDQQRISHIRDQREAHDLIEVNRKIEELNEKTKNSFRHLQKPLSKLQSLMREGEIQTDPAETKKLADLLNDPLETLATEEEDYPLLKSILKKTNDAIAQGKLTLKSSRLKKAQEQLDDILINNTLSPLREECKKALAEKQRLFTSETADKYQKELGQLEMELRDLKVQRDQANSSITNLKEEHQEKLQRIQKQKGSLENALLELTGKQIKINI